MYCSKWEVRSPSKRIKLVIPVPVPICDERDGIESALGKVLSRAGDKGTVSYPKVIVDIRIRRGNVKNSCDAIGGFSRVAIT